ncbi:hypothetical protein [Streptomyces sp. R35]|uniref:Uncharacterized protein n=1 Tax=Streptomyces sp. R35 TaxID=3238630 RepID=A0AB39SKX0_9ACTN
MNAHPPPGPGTSEAVTPEYLRKQYEAGATVEELVTASGLSYGTVSQSRAPDPGIDCPIPPDVATLQPK